MRGYAAAIRSNGAIAAVRRCASSALATSKASGGAEDTSQQQSASAQPPVPPQSFDVMYEPGTRRFTMIGTSPVTNDTVVVQCDLSGRALPRLTWDSTYGLPSPHATQQASPARRNPHQRRRFVAKHVAHPTYSPDALPVQFRAFVGSSMRKMCMELHLTSLDGLLGIDGVVMHPGGVVRSSIVDMPLHKASQQYQGPLMNQRHLAETMTFGYRQAINPLVPYRHAVENFTDRFVNPLACPFSRYSHQPVHTAPGRVTGAVAALAADVGIDDELALFVHKYALFVQREEDTAWLPRVDAALGGLLPKSRESQRFRRRLTR